MLLYPLVKQMIVDGGLIKPNFYKKPIPNGMGVLFVLNLFAVLGISLWLKWLETETAFMALFGVSAVGYFGVIDDTLGSGAARGIKGHILSLLNGKMTTGSLKALLGISVSFVISYTKNYPDYLTTVIDTLVISLSMNLFNLLDVRPGRAIKFFGVTGLILFFYVGMKESLMISSLLGCLAVYLSHELNAEVMMGDTGSNILGFTIGLALIEVAFEFKIIVLFSLILVHLLAEKASLNKIINNNKLLLLLDNLGRKH
jgi:UDP-GlcNAc:undecaprenyl-phosphate GlcNAc-1-phosphate transferase